MCHPARIITITTITTVAIVLIATLVISYKTAESIPGHLWNLTIVAGYLCISVILEPFHQSIRRRINKRDHK